MPEDKELKPCPFKDCKSKNVELVLTLNGSYVKCKECLSRGPKSLFHQLAVKLWNRRTSAR